MATFHHYAYSEAPTDRSVMAEDLGRSAVEPSAAPSHCESSGGDRGMQHDTVSNGTTIPETLAELLSPEWLNPVLATAVPGGGNHRRHPGPDRGAGVDERPLQDRGRPSPTAFRRACAPRDTSARSGGSARTRACPRSASTATSPAPSVCARSTACGPTSIRQQPRRRDHRGRSRGRATFCSALDFCTVDRVRPARAIRKLHAYAWEQPEIATANAVGRHPPAVHPARARAEGDQRQLRGAQRRRRARRYARRAGARDSYTHLSSRSPGAGWTIAHGDAHVGNTFVDREGRAAWSTGR